MTRFAYFHCGQLKKRRAKQWKSWLKLENFHMKGKKSMSCEIFSNTVVPKWRYSFKNIWGNFLYTFCFTFFPFMTQYARTELEGCKRNLDVLQNDFETKKMWTTSITIISSNLGENSFRQSKLKSFFVILSVFGSMLYSISI